MAEKYRILIYKGNSIRGNAKMLIKKLGKYAIGSALFLSMIQQTTALYAEGNTAKGHNVADHKEIIHSREIKTKTELLKQSHSSAIVEKDENGTAVTTPAGINIRIGGKVEVQAGTINQGGIFSDKQGALDYLMTNNHGTLVPYTEKDFFSFLKDHGGRWGNYSGIANNTKLEFKISGKDHNDIEYGAEIELNADVSQSKIDIPYPAAMTKLYAKGDFGMVAAGSFDGPLLTLQQSAASIAAATGGIDGDYFCWIPYRAVSVTGDVLNGLFLNDQELPYSSDYIKKANKIAYYTPKFNGLSAGIAFTPDVNLIGTVAYLRSYGAKEAGKNRSPSGYKNVVEAAVEYKTSFANNSYLAVSAGGEFGASQDFSKYDETANKTISTRRENLRAWQIGGKVGHKVNEHDFAIAASYGDWGKSGTVSTMRAYDNTTGTTNDVPVTGPRGTSFWTLGASYKYDKLHASVTYMNSKRAGSANQDIFEYLSGHSTTDNYNKFHAFSIGAEYKVKPGIVPYLEWTSYNHDTPFANQICAIPSANKKTEVKVNNGWVLLGGVKLKF